MYFLLLRFYKMNSTGKSWTVCWTLRGNAPPHVKTATGHHR